MKPFFDVQKNRAAYHGDGNKNTVHRSSLLAPKIKGARTNITFLNHFLLKRNYRDVILKVTAINKSGDVADTLSIQINEPIVYSINLEELFECALDVGEYLIEFFSGENLYIPFPAVIINHIGNDFTNSVHSFNRVLNDVFENDAVNKHHVCESSIDYIIDETYDTFFNFASGPFSPSGGIGVSIVEGEIAELSETVSLDVGRLASKNIFLSEVFSGNSLADLRGGGVVRILQPRQEMFYGRLLVGIVNRKTSAFSANHSYYDSSQVCEYFDNGISRRTYPYFADRVNRITMYPIMSPSTLNVHIEIRNGSNLFLSEAKAVKSPSGSSVTFNVDEIVNAAQLDNVSAFEVVAEAVGGRVPSRVNHQLIYGRKDSKSKLNCSINVSLLNERICMPPGKTGLTWGQILVDEDYVSQVGFCFNSSIGEAESLEISFYNEEGLIRTINENLNPGTSIILSSDIFSDFKSRSKFIWFFAKSNRADLSAESFHTHKLSHNSSGEHSF